MAYHHPSFPDAQGGGYYAPQAWTPATAPPAGGAEGHIQFGTFVLEEMQAQAAAAAYGTGGYPQMYHMAPGPFPPPYQQPPPHHMPHPPRSSSRNKGREGGEKRRAEASRPPGPPEGRPGPGQGREGTGPGNYPPQHYPHRPHAQPMQYAFMPYPMYPQYPHHNMHQHPPDYMYKYPSHRLPLENNVPPLPNSVPPQPGRNAHQEADVQSPKSTTSTQSRSRKQLSLVHPKTGMQIEHEELRPPSQSSMMPPRKQVSPPHSVPREPHIDKPIPKSPLHASQAREVQRKIEEKIHSKRTKPMTSSEVKVVPTGKQPQPEDTRRLEHPREKKVLPLQSPRKDEGPELSIHLEPSNIEPVPVMEAKVPQPRPTRKEATPMETHGLVQSTVVQVPVLQTQVPQKSISLERRTEAKDAKPEPARGRAPESKIPTAPSSKLSGFSVQPTALHETSSQEIVAEKTDPVHVTPKEEPKCLEEVPATEAVEPGKDEEDNVPKVEIEVEKEEVLDVQEQNEALVDAVEAPLESLSSNNMSEDRVKSPETVIVNEGDDDSQEEEENSEPGKLAGEEKPWEESEAQPENAPVTEVPVPNNEDSPEESKKEAPIRQDSIGRKGSGSLKSITSRSSLDKPSAGWRLQRENSRRGGKARLEDSEVFHKSSGNKIYSTDFLLFIRNKCPEKPNGVTDTTVWRDNLGGSLKSRASADRSRWSGKGSLDDSESRSDRASSRVATAWRDPGSTGRQFGNGQRSGSNRGVHRGRDLDDRWASRMASPFVTGGVGGLHRAEDRYVVGEMISDDPEEEARQKRYKAILNKLTPENFDRMFEQIKLVEVKEHKTLEGLIDQIFDKALNETTFCPLYASLCRKLMSSMPEFEVEGDKRKVTFRRLLLNKCQNEFEKGDAALRAADEVERRGLNSPEEIEKLRTAKKERMRSLGNMQFIGHLFKEEMLTEKIIHQCIVDLLREQDNPKFEDIECLCQLVSTVGRQLQDCKELNAYFTRITRLTEKCELDTRHRFMLLDLIELRERKWVARRKSEGPKKIDEIRRDAQEELTSKDPKRSGWGGLSSRSSRDRVDRGGGAAWQSRSGAPARTTSNLASVPYEREVIEPLTRRTSIGRTNSDEISLRPASGPSKTSSRTATQRPEQRPVESSSQDSSLGSGPRASSPARGAKDKAPATPIHEEGMDPDTLKRKVKTFLEEFYQQSDLEEVKTCIADLVGGGASKEEIVTAAIRVALDLRNVPVDERLTPLCGMMCDLIKDETLRPTNLRKGVEKALASLPEMAEDFPKAPVLLADMMEDLQRRENIHTSTIIKMIQGAGQELVRDGEDTALVESGFAIKVFLRILTNQLKSTKNPLPDKDEIVQMGFLNLYPSIERDRINIKEVLGFLDGGRPS